MTARARVVTSTVAVIAGLGLVGACGGPDGLQGRVLAVDAGRTGAAVPGGWVAVLTDDQLRAFLAASAIDTPPADQLAFVSGRVQHEAVGTGGGRLLPVDDKGRFTPTTTGPHVVCLLYPAGQVDLLTGCAPVDLPAKGTLTVGSGDGGVTASVHG